MTKNYKNLLSELKKLQESLINIGFICDELSEEDIDIMDFECYPFDDDLENVTADVADWISEIQDEIEE